MDRASSSRKSGLPSARLRITSATAWGNATPGSTERVTVRLSSFDSGGSESWVANDRLAQGGSYPGR